MLLSITVDFDVCRGIDARLCSRALLFVSVRMLKLLKLPPSAGMLAVELEAIIDLLKLSAGIINDVGVKGLMSKRDICQLAGKVQANSVRCFLIVYRYVYIYTTIENGFCLVIAKEVTFQL